MSKRSALLTTAAAAALVGAMGSSAMAFDTIDWSWEAAVVDTDVTITINATVTVPEQAALVQTESFQANVGNLTATATTGDVVAEPPVTPPIDVEGILTSATAVSNNLSVDAAAATLLHVGQFAYGTASILPADVANVSAVLALLPTGNANLTFGQGILAAEALDVLDPTVITVSATTQAANAGTDPIENLAVGVANNAIVNVDSGLLIGDFVQVAVSEITATATVDGTLSGGSLSNTATAVGNNLKINVPPVTP